MSLTQSPQGAQTSRRARKSAQIIFNNDGDVLGFPGMTPDTAADWIRKLVFAPLANTQVGALFWCLGHNTVRYGTKVAEFFAEDEQTFHSGTMWTGREITRALIERGMDPPKLIAELAAEHGIDCFISLRMNDGHDSCGVHLCRTKRQNPQMILSPLTRKEGEWYRPWQGLDRLLDYSFAEVREEKFRIIEEICRNYPVQGFELDFMRHPRYFAEGTEVKNAPLLTEFVRRVRRMMDDIERETGRHLELAVRVASAVSRSLSLGLDVAAWMDDRLVDVVTVSTMDSTGDLDIESFLPHRHDDCRLYGCVPVFCWYGQYPTTLPTLEELRGISYDFLCRGFDGIYLWNANYLRQVNPNWTHQELREIGDAKTLARLSKTYRVYNVIHVPRPLADPDPQLPASVSEDVGHPNRISFSVGDDPADADLHADLQFEIFNRTYLDELHVELNDHPLNLSDSETQPMMSTSSDAGCERVTFRNVKSLLKRGRNVFTIVAHRRNPAITQPVRLIGLKLFVKYGNNI